MKFLKAFLELLLMLIIAMAIGYTYVFVINKKEEEAKMLKDKTELTQPDNMCDRIIDKEDMNYFKEHQEADRVINEIPKERHFLVNVPMIENAMKAAGFESKSLTAKKIIINISKLGSSQ